MNKLNMILALVLAVSVTSAFAETDAIGWSHARLRSKEGVSINIDYQYRPKCHVFNSEGRSQSIRLAEPVWINVDGVDASRDVRVEIESWTVSYITHGTTPQPHRAYGYYDRTLQLSPTGDFSLAGTAGSLAIRHDISSSYTGMTVFQKLRITVDGQALTDPVSGGDQFTISLDDGRGCL